jgi:Arc/MetJ family transcription regulator
MSFVLYRLIAADSVRPRAEMMYSSYIMKRTQIYLDEQQAAELNRRARLRGTTASKMIREAIDEYLAEPDGSEGRLARYRAALDASFGIAPYLPDGAVYVEQIRQGDRDRDRELTERMRPRR